MSSTPPPPPPPPPMAPPPGFVAYGGAGAHGTTFKRIGGLTTALVALTAIGIVASVLSLVVQSTLRDEARDFRRGLLTSTELTDKLSSYVAVIALASSVSLAALVLQIIWTFRIAQNLRVLQRQTASFAPGSTIAVNILGGCTLGILPYFMWRELWKGSDPEAPVGGPAWEQRPVGTIVHLWLASTLVTVAASIALGARSVVWRVNTGSNSALAKQLDEHFGFIVLAGLMGIVTSLLFLGLIRQLAARHMQCTHER